MSRQVKFRHFSCLDFECCKKLQLFASGRKPPAAGLYVACSYLAIAVKNLNKYFKMNMAGLRASRQFPHRMQSPRHDFEGPLRRSLVKDRRLTLLLWSAAELPRFLVIPQGGIFTNGERLSSSKLNQDKITMTWMLSYDRVAPPASRFADANGKAVWSHAAAYLL